MLRENNGISLDIPTGTSNRAVVRRQLDKGAWRSYKKVKATGRDVGALGTFMGVVRGPVRG